MVAVHLVLTVQSARLGLLALAKTTEFTEGSFDWNLSL